MIKTEILSVKIPKDEIKRLFNFLRGKIFALETIFGGLMIQDIQIHKIDPLLKMTL